MCQSLTNSLKKISFKHSLQELRANFDRDSLRVRRLIAMRAEVSKHTLLVSLQPDQTILSTIFVNPFIYQYFAKLLLSRCWKITTELLPSWTPYWKKTRPTVRYYDIILDFCKKLQPCYISSSIKNFCSPSLPCLNCSWHQISLYKFNQPKKDILENM